jgi:serine/threonine protein kinase
MAPESDHAVLLQELRALEREYDCRGVETAGVCAGQVDAPVRLGRYRITAKLGAGSFGVIYKGYDEALRRDVAIKVPHRHRCR